MPVYEYVCVEGGGCKNVAYRTFNRSGPPDPPPTCPDHRVGLRRRFGFSTPRMDHGGFDVSLGQHFETTRERQEHLRKISAEQTERFGYEVRLSSVHPADMAATSGIDPDSEGVYSRRGQPNEEVVRWL